MLMFRGVFAWLLVCGAAYVLMILLNSLGASMHGEAQSYGSSRLQQEISGLARIAIHCLPAIAAGMVMRGRAWLVAAFLSLLIEGMGATRSIGGMGLPYIGPTVAEILVFVLLGGLTAFATETLRQRRKSIAVGPNDRVPTGSSST